MYECGDGKVCECGPSDVYTVGRSASRSTKINKIKYKPATVSGNQLAHPQITLKNYYFLLVGMCVCGIGLSKNKQLTRNFELNSWRKSNIEKSNIAKRLVSI